VKIRVCDVLIIAAAVLTCVFFCINAFSGNARSLEAYIKADAQEYIFALDRDIVIEVTGPIGITRIAIKDGKAYFVDSPCPGKICVHSQPVSKQGEWIACLPNRVLLTVESRGKSEIDATSY
jgi:hypothetical protein